MVGAAVNDGKRWVVVSNRLPVHFDARCKKFVVSSGGLVSSLLGVGFFLHVPFPSYEIFRQLPLCSTILRALLAHDLIGFHDYSYLTYFAQTVHYGLD